MLEMQDERFMPSRTLEQRVTRLEGLVRQLIAADANTTGRSDGCTKTIGMFAGDHVMREVTDEGTRIRQEERGQTSTGCPGRRSGLPPRRRLETR